jgi:hypothetical protein
MDIINTELYIKISLVLSVRHKTIISITSPLDGKGCEDTRLMQLFVTMLQAGWSK